MYAGNWKMNLGKEEAIRFFQELLELFSSSKKEMLASEYVIFPQAMLLGTLEEHFSFASIREKKKLELSLGVQNAHWEEKGAYTGEISPLLAKEFAASYVLAGHSERRQYFGETNEEAAHRAYAAQKHSLKAMFCVGESLKQREAGKTLRVLEEQFRALLSVPIYPESLVIAYEPVWAIGTGKLASVKEAEEVHAFLRQEAQKSWGERADSLRILYGGSVKPENSLELLSCENIDGFLVGGASLQAKSFFRIAENALQC